MSSVIDSCSHPEASIYSDEKDGTLVCMDCGLVLEENLPLLQNIKLEDPRGEKDEKLEKLKSKIRVFGVRLEQSEQKIFLLDWIENGHLPLCVIDQTWSWSKRMIDKLEPENIHPRDKMYFNLEEFTAIALYQTLCKQNNPRSLTIISSISGVPVKKLWRLARIFPLAFNFENLRPSNWMPGLYTHLPISFKESVHIGKIADWLQQDFAFNPLSLLTIIVYAYLIQRKDRLAIAKKDSTCSAEMQGAPDNAVDFRGEKFTNMLTKSELSRITGVSSSTITKGYRKVIEDNSRFNRHILYFSESV